MNQKKNQEEDQEEKLKKRKALAHAIATNAADLRYEKGWSREMAAEKADISARAYAALELCENTPSLNTVLKVAAAYGVSVSELIGEVPRNGKIQSSLDDLNQRMDELTHYLQRFVPKQT